MANTRLSMRKIKEVLRLHLQHKLGTRPIARVVGASPSTVGDYLARAAAAGLTTLDAVETLSETALERALFAAPAKPPSERPLPDWAVVHREMRAKNVTLALLWEEYKAVHPDGLQYSQFCQRYRDWRGQLDLVMRQTHRAGEKLFVDYAGHTIPIVERDTGEFREAQIFVATLGASNFTFAEATWGQTLPEWCASHVRAFDYIGGVPALVVPDNLKSAVTRACRYDPELNPSYQALAEHYGVAVMPARVRAPRDKAKVEAGVQFVERWILAALRHQTFFSLAELNAAIAALLQRLNARAFRKLAGSRRTLFEQLDAPALGTLPAMAFVFSDFKPARVNIDYHIELDGHYYSVPYALVRREVMLRYTASTVEVLHAGERVAVHARSHRRGAHTTVAEHMAPAHRAVGEWTPERLVRWAEKCGPAVAELVRTIINERAHPQQGYRACLGILRLANSYGEARLDTACQRALLLGAHSYRSVASILKRRLDERDAEPTDAAPIAHHNVRGPGYYQ